MIAGKYRYRVFNLNIVSDFVLNGLTEHEYFEVQEADVNVIYGKVPESLEQVDSVSRKRCGFLFMIPDFAKGYVVNGNKIIIEPINEIPNKQITQIILISAFYKLLVQRGFLTLHGSSMLIDGKCVIFLGESGSGKTSLSLAFKKMGYQLMSDDIAAITVDNNGTPFVQPSYPQQRIKRNTAEINGINIFNLTKIDFEEDKYFLPVKSGFSNTQAPLAALFELRPEECESVFLSEVCGMNKLPILINHTHGLQTFSLMGLRDMHFKRCMEVAKTTQMFRIHRPENKMTVNRQLELVIDKLKNS